MPALVTLASDPEPSVKASTIPALGTSNKSNNFHNKRSGEKFFPNEIKLNNVFNYLRVANQLEGQSHQR